MAGDLIMGGASGFAVKAELNWFEAKDGICSPQLRQAPEWTVPPPDGPNATCFIR